MDHSIQHWIEHSIWAIAIKHSMGHSIQHLMGHSIEHSMGHSIQHLMGYSIEDSIGPWRIEPCHKSRRFCGRPRTSTAHCPWPWQSTARGHVTCVCGDLHMHVRRHSCRHSYRHVCRCVYRHVVGQVPHHRWQALVKVVLTSTALSMWTPGMSRGSRKIILSQKGSRKIILSQKACVR